MDLNKAMIIGRLTRDPESRTIPSGVSVCTFSVATGNSYTGKDGNKVDQTEFHNIVAWRKLGEIAQQYLKKGSQVYIEGRIQTRSWEDAQGQKKYRTEIVAENLIMLGSPRGGNAQNTNQDQESFNNSLEQLPTINQGQPDEDISVEDIPF